MEKTESWDEKSVINQLNQGMQIANELKKQLDQSSNSREGCGILVENIVSCYDNALALLNCMDFLENGDPTHNVLNPRSEDFKDHVSTDNVHKNKKRKNLPKWSEEVTVSSGAGFEGIPADGYFWRKYGQKDIFGATYPRAYYRCTHRHTQGCLAKKQVQRMEDNTSSIFKVVYRGKHICSLKHTKENVNVVIEQEEEQPRVSQEMMNTTASCLEVEPQSTHFLVEPISDSYFTMSPCFLNDVGNDYSFLTSESYVGDLDFFIDETNFDSYS